MKGNKVMKYMNNKIQKEFHFDCLLDLDIDFMGIINDYGIACECAIHKDFDTITNGSPVFEIEGSHVKSIREYIKAKEIRIDFEFCRHTINDTYVYPVKLIIHYYKTRNEHIEKNPFNYKPDRIFMARNYLFGEPLIRKMLNTFIRDVNDRINNVFNSIWQELKELEENPIHFDLNFDFESEGFLKRLCIGGNEMKDKIKSITLNKKKGITTVVFKDGDVQMSKCSDKDTFDENVGVALCIASHLAGSKTKFKDFVAEHTKEKKK